jgi:hypothetical protein
MEFWDKDRVFYSELVEFNIHAGIHLRHFPCEDRRSSLFGPRFSFHDIECFQSARRTVFLSTGLERSSLPWGIQDVHAGSLIALRPENVAEMYGSDIPQHIPHNRFNGKYAILIREIAGVGITHDTCAKIYNQGVSLVFVPATQEKRDAYNAAIERERQAQEADVIATLRDLQISGQERNDSQLRHLIRLLELIENNTAYDQRVIEQNIVLEIPDAPMRLSDDQKILCNELNMTIVDTTGVKLRL